MARSVANVNIAVDTFNGWVTKTNILLDALTNEIVTANSQANGALTTGNGFVNGVFGANTIVVPAVLRGGNVQSSNTLNITSNVVIGNTITINSSASFAYLNTNTHIQSSNVYVNATTISLYSDTGNVNLTATNVVVTATTIKLEGNINSNLVIKTDMALIVANTNLGSNTLANTIFQYDKTTYSSAKITSQSKNGTNVQIDEFLIAFDSNANQAVITVYGSVRAPSNANNGVYSVSTNASNVIVQFLQTTVSTQVKTIANLIKS
jgi:hypothetical protein